MESQRPSLGISDSILAEALDRQVREMGEQPWLFRREEEDWRWLSWSRAAAMIARLRSDLEETPPGRRAYRAGPSPDAYLVDLALRLEGLVPVAIPVDELLEPGQRSLEERLSVLDAGQAPTPDDTQRLLELEKLLPAAAKRDVIVVGNGPREDLDRLLLDWSLLRGAAVAFEHDPARLFVTMIWARPTIHHGPSTLLAGLTEQIMQHPKRYRSFLKRARMAVDGGPEGLSDSHASLWKSHGIPIVDVSGLLGTRSAFESSS